jgi:hypothetical protein
LWVSRYSAWEIRAFCIQVLWWSCYSGPSNLPVYVWLWPMWQG